MNAYQPVLDFALRASDSGAAAMAVRQTQRRLLRAQARRTQRAGILVLAVMLVVVIQLALATAATFGAMRPLVVEQGSPFHLLGLLFGALVVTLLAGLAWRDHRGAIAAEAERLETYPAGDLPADG